MKTLSIIKELRSFLSDEIPDIALDYEQIEYGHGNINTFFINLIEDTQQDNIWKKISNTIAIYFQAKLNDEFGKWNTYIFYLPDFEISKELKYKIENDTFSSRKIVVEFETNHEMIIEQYIKNTKIRSSENRSNKIQLFMKNENIVNALNDQIVKDKNRRKPEVAQAVLNNLYSAMGCK